MWVEFESSACMWWRWKLFWSHYCGPMSLGQRTYCIGHWVRIITAILHRDNTFYLTSLCNTENVGVHLWPLNIWLLRKGKGHTLLVCNLSKLYIRKWHGNLSAPGRVWPISKSNHCCLPFCVPATKLHADTAEAESSVQGELSPSFNPCGGESRELSAKSLQHKAQNLLLCEAQTGALGWKRVSTELPETKCLSDTRGNCCLAELTSLCPLWVMCLMCQDHYALS